MPSSTWNENTFQFFQINESGHFKAIYNSHAALFQSGCAQSERRNKMTVIRNKIQEFAFPHDSVVSLIRKVTF